MILIHTNSGLANRMRVIVSGIGIAEELKIPLKIIWESDKDLNSEFSDLFEMSEDLQISSRSIKAELIHKLRNRRSLLKVACKLLNVGITFFDRDIIQTALNTESRKMDPAILKNVHGDIYFSTCHDFYFKKENLRYLVPNQTIREKVNEITQVFNPATIGVHIRRTDNKDSILMSPIELFCIRIEEEIEKNQDACFYLATDDPELKEYLIEKYKEKIVTADITYSRTDLKGMEGAMIDLYCLAKTQKILGSYWSSFSEMASFIGDIPLVIVRK